MPDLLSIVVQKLLVCTKTSAGSAVKPVELSLTSSAGPRLSAGSLQLGCPNVRIGHRWCNGIYTGTGDDTGSGGDTGSDGDGIGGSGREGIWGSGDDHGESGDDGGGRY
ncbi:hypothetical protein Tco_1237362 [Tanacetum coccineum]